MKYYKLIYSHESEIEKEIQEYKDWIDGMNSHNKLHFPQNEMYDYDEEEIEDIKKMSKNDMLGMNQILYILKMKLTKVNQ